MKTKIESKYFSEKEFNRCTPSCSLQDMDRAFMWILDAIREEAGIPLILSCAFRSKEYDKSWGRSGNSAHTKGLAVDIKCNSSATRMKIVAAAIMVGIDRIGIGKDFVHLDYDRSLPRNVMWEYYD